jgi:hypothetical protein
MGFRLHDCLSGGLFHIKSSVQCCLLAPFDVRRNAASRHYADIVDQALLTLAV